ncbi:hypothetical protein T12_15748 [Trichinella patagoniensis]|uniref:Uncharacterized protein n=1 Tax=Trichinella patagoniensis TaxID=990121 RepID=A0A0V0ZU03_9BILA|nr:hypothetical protein T12_15748 [Trichinella patagoniensis]
MLCKLIPPLTIIYLNEYCMGNQWKGCCIEVKSAVRSTCSALLVAIVSRAGTFFNADDKSTLHTIHPLSINNDLKYDLVVMSVSGDRWSEQLKRDFRAEKLIISEMEIVMFNVQELSTVTLSMCHWNWDQKKCLEEEQA